MARDPYFEALAERVNTPPRRRIVRYDQGPQDPFITATADLVGELELEDLAEAVVNSDAGIWASDDE